MAEIVSFRDPAVLKSDPAIDIIRTAVIQFFDELIKSYERNFQAVAEFQSLINGLWGFLNGNDDFLYEEYEVDEFNTFPDIEDAIVFLTQNGFANGKEMRERFGEVKNCLFFECLTSGRCFASMRFLTDFFEQSYSDRFDVYPLVIKEGLKFFGNHAVIILKDKLSGFWYLTNPSNILDTVKLSNGIDYQRSMHTLRAGSYNSLVKLAEEIDGGIWPPTEMELFTLTRIQY